jgi:hypothetical protein
MQLCERERLARSRYRLVNKPAPPHCSATDHPAGAASRPALRRFPFLPARSSTISIQSAFRAPRWSAPGDIPPWIFEIVTRHARHFAAYVVAFRHGRRVDPRISKVVWGTRNPSARRWVEGSTAPAGRSRRRSSPPSPRQPPARLRCRYRRPMQSSTARAYSESPRRACYPRPRSRH